MSKEWLEFLLVQGEDLDDLGNIIVEGGWSDQGKWQTRKQIIELISDDGRAPDIPFKQGFYEVYWKRNGSYWNDYDYDDPIITEVELYTEMVATKRWRDKGANE